jgi:hypothetical protein
MENAVEYSVWKMLCVKFSWFSCFKKKISWFSYRVCLNFFQLLLLSSAYMFCSTYVIRRFWIWMIGTYMHFWTEKLYAFFNYVVWSLRSEKWNLNLDSARKTNRNKTRAKPERIALTIQVGSFIDAFFNWKIICLLKLACMFYSLARNGTWI